MPITRQSSRIYTLAALAFKPKPVVFCRSWQINPQADDGQKTGNQSRHLGKHPKQFNCFVINDLLQTYDFICYLSDFNYIISTVPPNIVFDFVTSLSSIRNLGVYETLFYKQKNSTSSQLSVLFSRRTAFH